jgi:hypothetical protein
MSHQINWKELLPDLGESERGKIALMLLVNEISKGNVSMTMFGKPNNVRREIIARARALSIEPNKILALYYELISPQIDALFKPITPEDIVAYEKEKDDLQKKKDSLKNPDGHQK